MKNVVQDLTSAGIDWQREKWQSGLGSKFIHQGEKNAAKYADEVIVLSKGVQDYFKETYAHPHVSGNCSRSGSGTVESEVVGVHNGIIENYTELKEKLLKHRERNHDGTVFSGSDVDIRRKDRKQLEEDTVAKRKDSVQLFSKH